MRIEVRQAPQEFADLARKLKQAEERGLRRELYKGLNRAAKPMQAEARRRFATDLPQRGGLAKRAARARMSVQQRRDRNGDAQIRIRARAGAQQVDLRAIDRGFIRHLVFGRPDSWVQQIIVPDRTWTDAMIAKAPEARKEIEAALDTVAAELNRKGR